MAISTIHPTNHSSFSNAVRRFESAYQVKDATSRKADVVEISEMAQLLSREDQAQGVRQALVAQVKAEIQAGVYETPEKLDAAMTHLMQSLRQG